ncbi:hypothetical protein EDD18DRAFT_1110323 [Armillaria luteobubalina]|uniref:F-box domain-containing protein n=1 Tax=Armillaria luteobubalina TaxID=153913 RepID=A0AA39UGF3_9AGAR|nr:hypothetical protein EDD18DRAFT_1110323 [Armillaria luteobubalina]
MLVQPGNSTFTRYLFAVVEAWTKNSLGRSDWETKSFEEVFRKLLVTRVHSSRATELVLLLSSNDPPSEVDCARFLADIIQGHKDIEQMTQWSVFFRAVVGHIDVQLKVAAANVEDVRVVVHPIRRVNDDVFGEIFQWCAAIESSLNSNDVRGVPWTLSQVCRHWRTLVLNMSSLWSRVKLNFGVDGPFMASFSAAHALTQQMIRARPYDTCLDVTVAGSIFNLDTNCVFRALLPFSSYFRSFTIDAGPSSYAILAQCKGSFDRLEDLSICDLSYGLFGDQDVEDPYHDLAFDAFTFAPNLERLQIYVLPLRAFEFASSTLNTVTRFSAPLYTQWTSVFEAMEQMDRLKELDLTCDCNIDDVEDEPVSIVLPSLRRMVLRDPESWLNIPHVWNKINAPEVDAVLLSYEGEYSVVTYPFLLVSAVSITELHIHIGEYLINFDDHCSSLVQFLWHTPNVIVFCFRTAHPCMELFQDGLQDTTFLPKLCKLSFGYSGHADEENDAHFIEAMSTNSSGTWYAGAATLR